MKIKTFALFLVALLCFSLTACGNSEPKRPVDYPNSKWTCEAASITFSVTDDGKVTDATMVDKNGETISISIVFTNVEEGKASITNADETETYLSGTCTYDEDLFSIFVTDIYNPDLGISSTRLAFNRT